MLLSATGIYSEAAELQSRGAAMTCVTTVHKWDPVTVGTAEFYTPLRCSERPAYTIRATLDAKKEELARAYCCTGLKKAHPFQQVILCRCRSHELARCILLSARVCFGYQIRTRLVCSTAPEEARAKAEIENQWNQFCASISAAEGRTLPDFEAQNVQDAFRTVTPPELQEAYQAMASTV